MVDAVQSYANLLPLSPPLLAVERALQGVAKAREKNLVSGAPDADATAEPHNVRARLGRERIDELVARYVAVRTTSQLMEEFGLSKTAVLALIRQAGVELRRQPLKTEQVAQARELYCGGASLAAVGQRLGIARESVRRALIEGGVLMRPRGGREATLS